MKDFKVAVVGTGFIGPVHAEGLLRAGINVVSLIGSSPEKSKQASEALGLPGEHLSFEDVLADDTIDAVHLATPNRLHFEQSAAVLKAGKHVLCEKPLAMNSQQSAELVDLAKTCERVAGVAYNIRFYPLCHEAAARREKGELGELFHVTGSYVQDWLFHKTDFNWRILAEEGGELRAVADVGTHWLDLIQFITGQHIVSVCADLRTVYTERERPLGNVQTFSGGDGSSGETETIPITTEDCGSVMLRFANGANGSLWVSQTTAGRKNSCQFEIAGSNEAYAWHSERSNQLWIGRRDGCSELCTRDPSAMNESAAGISQYPAGHNEGFPDTFKQLFRSFYGYIERGDFSAPCPFPTFADGHREILLCEAILRSHRESRWVTLGENT